MRETITKAKAETLHDFRELSIHKSNRVITKNFAVYLSGCDQKERRMICFLLFEANRYNVIKFSNQLLERFGAYVQVVQEKFGNDKGALNASRPSARKTFLSMISTGILIPISEKKLFFLVNPALIYYTECFAEQTVFMREYQELYQKYSLGAVKKDVMGKMLSASARHYYNSCINKK